MRTLLTGLLLAALVPLVQAAEASAAPTPATVIGGVGALADYDLAPTSVGCDDPAVPGGAAPAPGVLAMGPATPPRGQASFGFVADETSAVGFAVSSFYGPFIQLDMSLHTTAPVTGVATASFRPADDAFGTQRWVGRATWQEGAAGWRAISYDDRALTWTRTAADGTTVPDPANGSLATVAAFAGEHPVLENSFGVDYFLGFGCTTAPFHLDALGFTVPHPSGPIAVAYDFDGIALRCRSLQVSSADTNALTPRTVKAHFIDLFANIRAGVPARLQAKSYGETSFTNLVTKKTDSSGLFAATDRPLRTTTYRVQMPAVGDYLPCTSESFQTPVRTRASIALADATIRLGDPIVVTGRTTPSKPGTTLWLWRLNAPGGGEERLKSTTVRSDGSYRVSYRPTRRGKLTVLVIGAGGTGNAPALSAHRTATVS